LSAPRGLLAFRSAVAVRRLPPGSEACPLSLREVLRGLAGRQRPLPVVWAPLPAVARAALLAAKRARAALGLALPRGFPPEPWFDAVAAAADELAPRLPLVLCGQVVLEGGGEAAVERAAAEAHRLVEAGFGHLALDVAAAPLAERARAAARVGASAVEWEVAVECLLPRDGIGEAPEAAVSFVEELEGWGLRPDLVGLRCAAPEGAEAIRAQVKGIAALAAALGPVRLARRGAWAPVLLRVLGPAGAAAADDGGRILDAALEALPEARRAALRAPPERGRRAPGPEPEEGDRVEARAFAAAEGFLEGLGAAGTAGALAAALAPESA
jgi:hypothetical protein